MEWSTCSGSLGSCSEIGSIDTGEFDGAIASRETPKNPLDQADEYGPPVVDPTIDILYSSSKLPKVIANRSTHHRR